MNISQNVPDHIAEKSISVHKLNAQIRNILEQNYQSVVIEGEISNLATPRSGHIYFSIKDEKAQLRCALFNHHRNRLSVEPEDGMAVLVTGKISVYSPRGDLQLIAQQIYPLGSGALQRAFEQLYRRLKSTGLFDKQYKKPIPDTPRCIGVITSATGAAVHDILTVLKRRAPQLPVIIYPSLVQGARAAEQLIQQIETANQRSECDVLILSRGGGSLEDLWPFNDEGLAHAIAGSKIPIISGVGHEVDVTISDCVADLRAATPSAAAERVSPDKQHLITQIQHHLRRLEHSWLQHIQKLQQICQRLNWRLQHQDPKQKLIQSKNQLIQLTQRLPAAWVSVQRQTQSRLEQACAKLSALSPLNTLARGFSIVFDSNQRCINSIEKIKPADNLTIRCLDGELGCQVNTVKKIKNSS